MENKKIKNEEIRIIGHKKPSLKTKISEFFKNPKKRLIFIIVLGVILIVIFGIGLYFLTTDKPTEQTVSKTETTTTPTETTASGQPAILDGVKTDEISANRHPLAVIVENHVDARPQYGLSKASVVYEAFAEGGITRFLAIFGTNEADKVGPIRSARTYFVDWLEGYNAYFAHVGGNINALDKITSDKILDLNQFTYSGPYYRDRSSGADTEHTMFSSTTKLRELATSLKYPSANNFSVYKFKDDPTVDQIKETAVKNIIVNYSTPSYLVKFTYEKETNSYKRFLGGKSAIDNGTKNQINPKNVIIMTVKKEPIVTRINEKGYSMTTVGTGKAQIYIDGQEIIGKWKKDSSKDREIFYDENDKEVVFDRGQTWISVVSPDVIVTTNNE